MNKKAILGLNPQEIETFLPGEKAFRSKQVYSWLSKAVLDFSQMKNLPVKLVERLEKDFFITKSKIDQVLKDPDGTIKLQIELHDGHCIETVLLLDKEGRKTACVSCQVGCAMKCAFCKTGTLGLKRNLEAYEIIEQFFFLESIVGSLDNIVFMGMGEPMKNLHAIRKTITFLTDPKGRNLSPRRITLSTSGFIEGIYDLADNGPDIRLAISLTTANPHTRAKLMPITEKNPIPELKKAIQYYSKKKNKRVSLELALMKNINTSIAETAFLVDFAQDLNVHVNLIPWNPIDELPFEEPSNNEVHRVLKALQNENCTATIRQKRGRTIGGACGQLGKIRLEK